MKYILKANSNKGLIYFVNALSVTNNEDDARRYDDYGEAVKDMEYFRTMFTRADNLREFEILEVGSHPKLESYQAYYLDRAITYVAYSTRDVERLVELNRDWNRYEYKDVEISDDEAKMLLKSLVDMVDEILYDVYTDSEGCTYNSIKWKDGGIYETYIKKMARG